MTDAYPLLKARPQFWPTMITIPCLFLVIGLGVWQVQRLEWKTSMIEQIDARLQAEAVDIRSIADSLPANLFALVQLQGEWLHDKEVILAGRYYRNKLGHHVLTPLRLESGELVVVNRGWVPKDQKSQESRPESLTSGVVSLEGIVQPMNQRNMFTPENNPAKGEWYWVERAALEAYVGSPLLDGYVEQVRLPDSGVSLPIAADKDVEVRNDHLMYAITWFAIACSMMVIYVVYHRQLFRDRTDDR